MSNKPLVSVIVVNYNGSHFVGDCIDSILASSYPNFEVIVIDNASTDGSFTFLKKKYGKNENVRILKSKRQLYFTGGSNLGAKRAGGEKLFFLNSDTIIHKNCLGELAKFAKGNPKYLVQPKILLFDQKDTIDNVGGKYSFWGFGFGIGRGEKDNGQYDKTSRVDFVNGTAFMIDKKFFQELGGFDEWYKFHYEDVDLALRAKKQGGECWYCWKSIIYHYGSLTIRSNLSEEDLLFNIRKNRLQTVVKNFGGWERISRLFALLILYFSLIIKDLAIFRVKRAFLTFKSILATLNLKSLLLYNISTKQIIFKNTFWLMFSEFLLKIPTFLLNIGIIRYLSAEGYGKFSFAFGFTSLFAIFTDFGISTLTIREVAKNKNLARKYIDNLLVMKLIFALLTFVLIFAAMQVLGKSLEVKAIVYLAAIFVTTTSFISFFHAIFQAFEKMEYLAISRLIYSLSLPALAVVVIWQDLGLKILTSTYVYSTLITLIITSFLVKRKFAKFGFKIDLLFWRKTLAEAWPFGLIAFFGGMSFALTTTQISLIAGNRETGLYNVSYQFVFILTTLVGLFFSALFPTLSREYQISKVNFYNLLDFFAKRIILACFVVCLIFFLTSPVMVLSLYGKRYFESIGMLKVLLVSLLILFINTPYAEALKIMGQQKEYLRSVFWGITLGFLLNFPLIFFFGGQGAALSTIFSSSVITILILKKFREFKKINFA